MSIKTLTGACLAVSLISFAGCGTNEDTKTSAPVAEVSAPVTLDMVINDTRREKDKARDQFRNPKETLEFFDVGPGKHVAEIWPGWYTEILAPYLAENDGTYTAIMLPATERRLPRINAFKEKFGDTETYGTVQYGTFGKDAGPMMAPESADVILTFRNVHNWMRGSYADKAFEDFYAALKPGGILGVVEHRLPESALQDPTGASGYVQESYMKDLAKKAGFEFIAASEINANPRDTADHPFGVWTLPPRSRVPEAGSEEAADFDAELYKNIGESDRATLKFRKPSN
jgi:predicted methyltransferase